MRDLKSTQLDILLFLYLLHTLSIHYLWSIYTLSLFMTRPKITIQINK
jgi:hypothetical protein